MKNNGTKPSHFEKSIKRHVIRLIEPATNLLFLGIKQHIESIDESELIRLKEALKVALAKEAWFNHKHINSLTNQALHSFFNKSSLLILIEEAQTFIIEKAPLLIEKHLFEPEVIDALDTLLSIFVETIYLDNGFEKFIEKVTYSAFFQEKMEQLELHAFVLVNEVKKDKGLLFNHFFKKQYHLVNLILGLLIREVSDGKTLLRKLVHFIYQSLFKESFVSYQLIIEQKERVFVEPNKELSGVILLRRSLNLVFLLLPKLIDRIVFYIRTKNLDRHYLKRLKKVIFAIQEKELLKRLFKNVIYISLMVLGISRSLSWVNQSIDYAKLKKSISNMTFEINALEMEKSLAFYLSLFISFLTRARQRVSVISWFRHYLFYQKESQRFFAWIEDDILLNSASFFGFFLSLAISLMMNLYDLLLHAKVALSQLREIAEVFANSFFWPELNETYYANHPNHTFFKSSSKMSEKEHEVMLYSNMQLQIKKKGLTNFSSFKEEEKHLKTKTLKTINGLLYHG